MSTTANNMDSAATGRKASQAQQRQSSRQPGAQPNQKATRGGGGGGGITRTKRKTMDSSDRLRAKEEEYRQLNAELEAKTATLVKEAEELVEQFSVLSDEAGETLPDREEERATASNHSPLLNSEHSGVEYSHQHSPKATKIGSAKSIKAQRPHSVTSAVSRQTLNPTKPLVHSSSSSLTRPHSTPSTGSGGHKPKPTLTNKPPLPPPAPLHSNKKAHRQPSPSPSPSPPPSNHHNSHHHNSHTSPPPPPSSSSSPPLLLQGTVEKLERELDTGGGRGYHGDDVIPEVAEDMGPEALVRFMKAKLRVMQEELDHLNHESSEKSKEISLHRSKVKELAEQNMKLQKSQQTLQTQVSKLKQSAGSVGQKCESLEMELSATKQELEALKADQRKATSGHSAVSVRLNRALEEVDRYKSALSKERNHSKDTAKREQQRLEQLQEDNRQLERQKAELIAAFKKQLRLIDVLKRQKMHLEAAKMLSFTEEEFARALNWETS